MEKEKPMEKTSSNQIVSNNFANYYHRKQRADRTPDMQHNSAQQKGGRYRGTPAQGNPREKYSKPQSPMSQSGEGAFILPSDDEVIAEYIEEYGPSPSHQQRRKQDRVRFYKIYSTVC